MTQDDINKFVEAMKERIQKIADAIVDGDEAYAEVKAAWDTLRNFAKDHTNIEVEEEPYYP